QEQTEKGDHTETNAEQDMNIDNGAGPSAQPNASAQDMQQYLPEPQTAEEIMDIILRNLWTFMELRIQAYDRWVCAKFQTSFAIILM
ncbi:hypothetical protein, partial [Serratia marcescens]|uniref:hypothetical protein n=1 Tax=Serratia marcescens TaxID=615 RepID=UPI002813194F